MSDGPYRSLPMTPRWRLAAKSAYLPAFSGQEIADALKGAVERDCQTELSPAFIGKVATVIFGPDQPGLFHDLAMADLKAMHARCASPMEASLLRNAIDALGDGYRASAALQQAAEGMVSDRLLAGYRQVEEHMFRESTDHRARAVRARLEEAHGNIDISGLARRALRAADAPPRAATVSYSGLDDGVPL
jgi:hypothetical protein